MNRRNLASVVLAFGVLVTSATTAVAASPNTKLHGRAPASLDRQLAAMGLKAPHATVASAPRAVRAAVALHRSLTGPQKVRLAKAPSDASPAQLDRLLKRVLTADQFAQHRVATRLDGRLITTRPKSPASLSGSIEPATLGSSCYTAAYYEALANYYEWYGYYYAYYNYITYGGSNAYTAYYDAYYAYTSYGKTAVQDLAAAYVSFAAYGADYYGLGTAGTTAAYYSYYYSYYAWVYALASYNNDGNHTYAYYAYQYENLAKARAYTAYYYAYYYCK